ncbi:MAG: cysteine dioxygenase family protein [Planctomycetota bacterium]
MTSPTSPSPSLSELIRRLDAAVEAPDDGTRCRQIKEALEWGAAQGESLLTSEMVRPHPDHYARRLLHKDPGGRYSAVLMIWGESQGTPLHDHAGSWCVECVFRGRIRVDNYSRIANRCSERGIFDFQHEGSIKAGVGEAGALIPPYEYHVIANDDSTPAVTLHVYGGEMVRCNVFLPADGGGYAVTSKELEYTA